MHLVAGNIIVRRLPDSTLVKVPTNTYDQQNYINLFKLADDLNRPHFSRLDELFNWLESDKKGEKPVFANDLETLLKRRALPEDPKELTNHHKKMWLQAYNEYYDITFLPQDVGL